MDLTKITTPFGLLDPETQAALKAHGGPYEMFHGLGWMENGHYDFNSSITYRVKPAPLTKPSIDWSHVAPEFKWLARDQCGDTYLYAFKPDAEVFVWVTEGVFCECKGFASYSPGTCAWRDSLVERPE
jgi:hypothetical protein